jgi:hypothetical protein
VADFRPWQKALWQHCKNRLVKTTNKLVISDSKWIWDKSDSK